jgi:hypothetical protein
LFIDEAYELGVGSFGNEVMTKLVQLLTDERYEVGPMQQKSFFLHLRACAFALSLLTCPLQHKMVVILAGYPDKMAAMFAKNAGLKSRFTESLLFQDWTSAQLSDVVVSDLKKSTPAYALEDEVNVKRELSKGFDRIRTNDPSSWANARDGNTMRDLIMKAFDKRAASLRRGCGESDAPAPAVSGVQFGVSMNSFCVVDFLFCDVHTIFQQKMREKL